MPSWLSDSPLTVAACLKRGKEPAKVFASLSVAGSVRSEFKGVASNSSNEGFVDARGDLTSGWVRDVFTDAVRGVSGVLGILEAVRGVDRSDRWKGEKLCINLSLAGVLSPAEDGAGAI